VAGVREKSGIRAQTLKQVLTIAGSDSGGGAGIQGDLKAMHANGVFGMSVIVSITAQNTKAVTAVHDLPLDIILAQIEAVFDDFKVSAVKTGMLGSSEIVGLVAERLKAHRAKNLVVDPVMISKSGFDLLRPEAVEKIKTLLIPLARLVTPNIPEAQRLADLKIRTIEDAKVAAKSIHALGCRAVLIKGGHLLEERGCDLLFDGRGFTLLHGEFIETPNTHGTGCTYSAAIAAHLAKGSDLEGSVRAAKAYITEAIRNALSIGHGHGPVHHFYFLKDAR
jgi:hydroxymethylpyrimidine/phosphomethylpyrimidine kinase